MKLSNQWIAGFTDGEGCFNIQKIKRPPKGGERTDENENRKENIRHRFVICQDKKSVNVLYGIKEKLKCGSVHKAGGNMMAFDVSKKEHLENHIIPFFHNHTLKTSKRESFSVFVKSFSKDTSNHQVTGSRKTCISFSDSWFSGFVDAEGCFSVSLAKDYPRPQLVIGLQSKEEIFLVELQKFLKCGTLRTRKDGGIILQIVKSKDLEQYVFPKLQTKGGAVMLQTRKRISYQIFRQIVRIIREKRHHTVQGLEKIKKLKKRLSNFPKIESFSTNFHS